MAFIFKDFIKLQVEIKRERGERKRSTKTIIQDKKKKLKIAVTKPLLSKNKIITVISTRK
jgi:hypothetical protein